MIRVAGLATLSSVGCLAAQPALADPTLRIDASVSDSQISGTGPDWHEASVAISQRFHDDWSGALKIETQSRFGATDTYAEVRLDHSLSTWSAFVALGGAHDADFRPEFAAKAGGSIALSRQSTSTLLIGDVEFSSFATGEIYTMRVGIDQALTDRWRTSMQIISVAERDGPALLGFDLRSEVILGDGLTGRVAYFDAPETSEGRVVRVRGWSAGLRFDMGGAWVMRADLTHEDRGLYARDELSAGTALRF